MNILVYSCTENKVHSVLIIKDAPDVNLDAPNMEVKALLLLYRSGLSPTEGEIRIRKYDPNNLEPLLVGFTRGPGHEIKRITYALLKQKAEAVVNPNITDITS